MDDAEVLPVYELNLSSSESLVSSVRSIRLPHEAAARVRCSVKDTGFADNSLLLLRNNKNVTERPYGHSVVYTIRSFDSNKGDEIFECSARRRDQKFHVRSLKFVRSRKPRLSNGHAECDNNVCRNNGVCLVTAEGSEYCACANNFMGPRCEHSFHKTTDTDSGQLWSLAIGAIVVLFVLATIFAVLFFRERRKNKRLKKLVVQLRRGDSIPDQKLEAELDLSPREFDDFEGLYDQADGKGSSLRQASPNEYDNVNLKFICPAVVKTSEKMVTFAPTESENHHSGT